MKKKISLVCLMLLVVSCLALAACDLLMPKTEMQLLVDGEVYQTINVTNGYSELSSIQPKKDGYKFEGWYLDETLTTPLTESNVIQALIYGKLYAKMSKEQTACQHTNADWETTLEPTCTQPGSKHKVCPSCNEELQVETIPATGHNYTSVETAPTCTEQGYTTHTCVCGDSYVDTYVDALNHDKIEHAAQNETCTEIGWDAYVTCSRCDYSTYEEIPATGHSHEAVVTEPTCLEQGYTTHTCHCGDSYVDAYVDALGHDKISHDAQAPTCTENGWDAYVTCTRCDHTTYEEIPALGHSFGEWDTIKPATCTEDGQKERVCECGEKETEVITAPGHSFGEWTPVSESTCTQKGQAERVCGCGEKETKELDLAPHTEVIDSAVAPTCTDTGLTEGKHCDVCREVLTEQQTLDALGHYVLYYDIEMVDSHTLQNDQTYPFTLSNGWYASSNKGNNSASVFRINAIYDCTLVLKYKVSSEQSYDKLIVLYNTTTKDTISGEVSEKTLTFNLKAGDVLYVKYTKDSSRSSGSDAGYFKIESCTQTEIITQQEVSTDDIEPTCTDAVVCERCQQTVKEALDHDEISHDAQAPTCTEIGWDAYVTCTRCDHTTYEEIPAKGHKDEDNNCICDTCKTELEHTEEILPGVEPTCTSMGLTEGKKCSVCNAILIERTEIPYKHNFVDGFCSQCGRDQTTSGLDFSEITDDAGEVIAYSVTGIGTATDIDIIVPSTHNDLPVTAISPNAFSNLAITSIIIPSSVTNIGFGAFSGCSSLTSITLPFIGADVTTSSADTNQYPLGYIFGTDSYDGGIVTTQIYYGLSLSKPTSKIYYIPGSLRNVTVLGGNILSGAFYNCSMLTDVSLLENVESISPDVFIGCSSLINITIPFVGARAHIAVSDAYQYPVGYIFGTTEYSGSTPVEQTYLSTSGRISTTYYLPATLRIVTVLSGNILLGAFQNCSMLTEIVLPSSGIQKIGESAFSGCSSLSSIRIPKVVTSIGNYAFRGCTKLDSVTFEEVSQCASIGGYAFQDCGNLINITIPSSVTSIDWYAFRGCTSLTSITIPSNVTSIGISAFEGCSKLSDISIEGSPQIGRKAFYNTAYYNNAGNWENKVLYLGSYLIEAKDTIESCAIKEGTTIIADYAFSDCTSLTNITIPVGVTSIGSSAFEGCTSLESIIIPESVTSIESWAFYKCTGLESITLPFIGNTLDGTQNNHFGYIFGASSYSQNKEQVPSSLKTVIITDGTSIGSSAFYGCDSLKSVIIPEGVTSIGQFAFENCVGLTSITIPASVQEIADGFVLSGYNNYRGVFSGCTGLRTIKFEHVGQLSKIGSFAFYGCSNLRSVYIKDMTAWLTADFSKSYSNPLHGANLYLNNELVTDLVIPSNITSINNNFNGCTSLTSITIHSSVTSIDYSAFADCSNLKSITLPFVGSTFEGADKTYFGYIFGADTYAENKRYVPSSLKTVIITDGTSIGSSAFYGCEGIENIIILEGVTSISTTAFYNCTSLKSITIPSSVTSIGHSVFKGCTSLESITLPFVGSSLENPRYTDFGWIFGIELNSVNNNYVPASLKTVVITTDTDIASGAFCGCTSITSVTIPSSVTSIGSSAFQDCTSLINVAFEKDSELTSIGNAAFMNCTSLKSITIPASVQTIADGYHFNSDATVTGMFLNCNSLESVTFEAGSQLTRIGSYAFYKCFSLTSITIPEGVTSIGAGAFYACDGLTSITIPASLKSIGADLVYGTFSGCSIESVYITDIAAWCSICFADETSNPLYIGGQLYLNEEIVINVVIPSGVTSIGQYAFYNYDRLQTVTFEAGSQCTSIGKAAFSHCSNLYSIELPASLETIEGGKIEGSGYGDGAFTHSGLMEVVFAQDSKCIKIGDYAFAGCDSLESIEIPSSVLEIGFCAFGGCTSLISITIPSGVKIIQGAASIGYGTFSRCSSLQTVKFADNSQCEKIGAYAFYGCSDLESITIPDSLTYIGDDAFEGCEQLKSVYITDISAWCNVDLDTSCASPLIYGAQLYLNNELITELRIPDGVTSIGPYAFYGCTSIETITIPSSVTSIGERAFYNCTSLTSVTIPENVTSIGSSAFQNCSCLVEVYDLSTTLTVERGSTTNGYVGFYAWDVYRSLNSQSALSRTEDGFVVYEGYGYSSENVLMKYIGEDKDVIIPNNIDIIYKNAFHNCSNIESITIPDNITIQKGAFSGCTNITTVTMSTNAISHIPQDNLQTVILTSGTSIPSKAFYNCTSLESITIPSSVTSISYEAFYGCSNLISVIFEGDSELTSIGEYAFHDCSSLQAINLEGCDYLVSIGANAFYNCRSLSSIVIPSNVTSIGEYAFYNCYRLVEVYDLSTKLTIEAGATTNGYVGCYARDVYTTLFAPSKLTTTDGFVLHTNGNEVTLINYVGTSKTPTIPDNVTSIGKYAFYQYTDLTNITIPEGVTSIGASAFYNCNNLTSVYYAGTETKWTNITIGSNNSKLTNATRYYYSECIHDSNQWRYDNGGNISTELTIGEWIVDVEPTCTTGSKHAICSVCGETVTLEIPALGHDYGADGICTVCGEEIPYTITNDATYAFVETDGVLQSTNKAHSSSSSYVITAKTAITITFEYNVSSESYDKFYIFHNSTQKVVLSGRSNSYTSYSITLNAGDTLTFKYTKDYSSSRGDDCCYIKNLTITTVN